MVGFSGLHSGKTFRHSNVSAGVRLKSFCPWCFRFWGNMQTISIHLREVHYWLAIVCNICRLFASISVQVILEHRANCKVKCATEHRVKKSLKKKIQGKRAGKSFLKLVRLVLINPAGQKMPRPSSQSTQEASWSSRQALYSKWGSTQLYKLSCYSIRVVQLCLILQFPYGLLKYQDKNTQ